MPVGTQCRAMLLNAFWDAFRATGRVLVDVPEAFNVACSIHVFVSVGIRARGAGFGYPLTLGVTDFRKTRNYENQHAHAPKKHRRAIKLSAEDDSDGPNASNQRKDDC